ETKKGAARRPFRRIREAFALASLQEAVLLHLVADRLRQLGDEAVDLLRVHRAAHARPDEAALLERVDERLDLHDLLDREMPRVIDGAPAVAPVAAPRPVVGRAVVRAGRVADLSLLARDPHD